MTRKACKDCPYANQCWESDDYCLCDIIEAGRLEWLDYLDENEVDE